MTFLSPDEIIERIEQFEEGCADGVGSIFPDNFFTSIKHWLRNQFLRDEIDVELANDP